MHLDLSDAETLALLNLLTATIENDRYPLSPRIQTLRGISVVSGKFCKSHCGGWSWYAGDVAITGSFGEDAHHDQAAG